MNTTERHFHHFGQVLHRRKRLLNKCIKIIYIRMKRGRSMWALLFHQSRCWSLATLSCLNQDNELCKKTEGKTLLAFRSAEKKNTSKEEFDCSEREKAGGVGGGFVFYHQRQSCRHRRCHRHRGKPWSRRRSGRVPLT